ncbi:MAG: DMT family transporter [Clostridia bacterium]|nr:DMT family transporter [Clostridia bacterium]
MKELVKRLEETKKNKTTVICSLIMLLTAVLWGFGFVVQSVAMNTIEPITFNGIRNLLGAISVLPVCYTSSQRNKSPVPLTKEEKKKERKTLITGGVCCGLCLFAGSVLQQTGLVYTTPGKAGFITALYIVLVPVFGLFLHKKVGFKAWIGVGIAVAGLYLLCVSENLKIEKGDFLVFLCAFGYSAHILTIDHFSKKTDGVKMSCIQFLVCGLLCIPFMFIFEHPTLSAIKGSWLTIAYAGVFSCGMAFTLQIVAQKHLNPTVASLIMSLESCFAALFGWLVLNQTMSGRELIGVALMAVAIVLAQI